MEWKKEEIDFLIENYPKYGLDYCAENIKRTKRAIQLKRKKLLINAQYSVKGIWQENNLKEIIKNSNSYIDSLKKLGFHNFGSSYNTLKKYIKKYNIDNSHFIEPEEHIKNLNKEIDLSLVLTENSTYSRKALKKRLYKEGLKEKKCELCGQGEEWKGKKMSLILDHVNGRNNDNRLENLRIVCPNCNATLETHCKGNYKNGRLTER